MSTSAFFVIGVFVLAPLHGCGDIAIGKCKYTDHQLAWDEASPEGIVAEDLLAFSEGEHNLIGGEIFHDGESEILLIVDRRGDNAIYKEDIEGGCFPYLEVPLTVTILTSIHESGETRQIGGVVYDHDSAALNISADLEPEHLNVSIDEIIEDYGDNLPEGERKFIRLGMETTFTENQITGSVYIDVQVTEGEQHGGDTFYSLSRMTLVSW